MAHPGKLRLTLLDVRGAAIREEVDVALRNMTRNIVSGTLVKGGKVTINDLLTPPDGVYAISVSPRSYKIVKQFVTIRSSGITAVDLTLPIEPGRVKQMTAPPYDDLPQDARTLLEASDGVLGFAGLTGEALYSALDDIRRAGLLNIVAKTRLTTLPIGRSVLSFITKLTELRGDRFFAAVPKELREETKNAIAAGLFVEADGLLHRPPDGFTRAGSYKTTDPFGNLQLTFFANADEWVADIDVDDAAGFGHIGQVVRNKLTGQPTHPFDIHQILLHHQQLDPGYVLVV
jgi:hypothetical protein